MPRGEWPEDGRRPAQSLEREIQQGIIDREDSDRDGKDSEPEFGGTEIIQGHFFG